MGIALYVVGSTVAQGVGTMGVGWVKTGARTVLIDAACAAVGAGVMYLITRASTALVMTTGAVVLSPGGSGSWLR